MVIVKRPGGPLIGKPVQGLDGQWYGPHGEVLEFNRNDLDYSERFWARGQPEGLREVMVGSIIQAGERGTLAHFVDPTGITDKDREKLSAYRVLALQMGYALGQYVFNSNAYTAIAPIQKAEFMR